MSKSLHDTLMKKVMVLSDTLWSGAQIKEGKIKTWLKNFKGKKFSEEEEQLYALFILSHFLFFGVPEFRELLRVMYRDLYLYPIIQDIRAKNGNTKKYSDISQLIEDELNASRFIGMGRPSESGSMLLYMFRQVNDISVDKFLYSHQVFKRYGSNVNLSVRNPSIRHYVFIDDLCGSGDQAKDYSRDIVSQLKRMDPNARAYYFVLFSTVKGMEDVRRNTKFDSVECVFSLDDSFKAFTSNSRYFESCPTEIERDKALAIFRHYGSQLWPKHPLGYKDGQLLLGFWHNTPDNTLPAIWYNKDPSQWAHIFERFHKI